jgi:hypothetical protein
MNRILPTLGLLLTLATPAFAQAPAAQPPVDPTIRAEAERTLSLMNMGSTMEQTMAALRGTLIAQLQQAGRVDEPRAATAVDELILPAMRSAVPEMMAGIATIWARHYTAAELRGLREFYETPLGRKSLALTPTLAQETAAMTQSVLPRILQDVINRNRDTLRGRGFAL